MKSIYGIFLALIISAGMIGVVVGQDEVDPPVGGVVPDMWTWTAPTGTTTMALTPGTTATATDSMVFGGNAASCYLLMKWSDTGKMQSGSYYNTKFLQKGFHIAISDGAAGKINLADTDLSTKNAYTGISLYSDGGLAPDTCTITYSQEVTWQDTPGTYVINLYFTAYHSI